jgi:Fic family protein
MLFATPKLGRAELEQIARLDDLRQQLRYQLATPRRWTGSLRRLAFARNVRASNSIEGIRASQDAAIAVVDGQRATGGTDEATAQALDGYRLAMTYVLSLAETPEPVEYSTQLIKSLHFMMLSAEPDKWPGRFRPGDIYVHDERSDRVVYEGPDAAAVPKLVENLAAALNADTRTPLVVKAAMAHLNLVMIHPFRDGNGRMARCLQSLVLGERGALSPVFGSVEEYLGEHTPGYYAVLSEVGGGSWQPKRDAAPWVRFMLDAHINQAAAFQDQINSHARLWDVLVQRTGLPEDDRRLLALFDAALGIRLTRASYIAVLARNGITVTPQTAGRDLAALVAAGWLTPKGTTKARTYAAALALETPISSHVSKSPG